MAHRRFLSGPRMKPSISIALISLTFAIGCTNGFAKTGQVVDKATGQPIPNAFVYATWWGRSENVVQGQSRCYSVAITQADGDGRFDLPESAPDSAPLFLTQRERHLTAFAPGFEEYPIRRGQTGKLEMRRFEGQTMIRLRNIFGLLPYACVTDKGEKKLVPLFEAIEKEAMEIAKTDREIQYAKQMRSGLERLRERTRSSDRNEASK